MTALVAALLSGLWCGSTSVPCGSSQWSWMNPLRTLALMDDLSTNPFIMYFSPGLWVQVLEHKRSLICFGLSGGLLLGGLLSPKFQKSPAYSALHSGLSSVAESPPSQRLLSSSAYGLLNLSEKLADSRNSIQDAHPLVSWPADSCSSTSASPSSPSIIFLSDPAPQAPSAPPTTSTLAIPSHDRQPPWTTTPIHIISRHPLPPAVPFAPACSSSLPRLS